MSAAAGPLIKMLKGRVRRLQEEQAFKREKALKNLAIYVQACGESSLPAAAFNIGQTWCSS